MALYLEDDMNYDNKVPLNIFSPIQNGLVLTCQIKAKVVTTKTNQADCTDSCIAIGMKSLDFLPIPWNNDVDKI
jgi:hypothetical protein